MKIEAYFKKLASQYNQKTTEKSSTIRTIQVGAFTIQMKFLGDSLIPIFYKAFSHLSIPVSTEVAPCLTLHFWEEKPTKAFPDIPWELEERHHLGFIQSYSNDRFFTLHQPGSEAIYMLDTLKNEGYYWVRSQNDIPYWESDFPLRMVFHWWFKDSSFQPVHAGAVGTEKGGVLLVGKGGSGKSTSTLACVNSMLKVAGDDYVLLDCKNQEVYSLFSLTKVNHNSLKLLPKLNVNVKDLNAPIDDKYRILLYPKHKESLIKKMPVLATLLPTVTDADKTTIVPCSSSEAMLALAPTTLFQLPGLREEAFAKMSEFARITKTYKLLLGKDSTALPNILDEFIQSLQ
ncbi:hypothetical protein [Aquimarina pacifica]|uniref:hypothetical protein n=1 Tax=Aquimarina pacifica TaxID=1296415 RepID=UPI000470382E|nr:hypothetical protein [Aquimarina pacifica]